jgi:LmbE family N-acetylglucosaminyl deacetylase
MPRVPIVALLTLALWTARPADAALPLMAVPGANDRVLVIAPHPDDESLCCAGLIQQTLNAGASVGIVWITAGDGFELDALVVERTLSPGSAAMQRLGKQRLREAHAAADALGVPRASQYVLGYPDRGVAALIGRGTRPAPRCAMPAPSVPARATPVPISSATSNR